MTLWVVGVDPGKSCGLAVLCDSVLFHAYQGTPVGMVQTMRTVLHGVLREEHDHDNDLIVAAERFLATGGGHRTHQADPQSALGAVRSLAREYGAEVVLQSPADAKAFASNDRLRGLGLWVTPTQVRAPDADDARDAVRHALLCMATRRAAAYEALLRGRGQA